MKLSEQIIIDNIKEVNRVTEEAIREYNKKEAREIRIAWVFLMPLAVIFGHLLLGWIGII